MCLVFYVPCTLHSSCPTCSCASRASCLSVFVSHLSYVLYYLICLAWSQAACVSKSTCPCVVHPSLVLLLSCLVPLVLWYSSYTSFLQFGLMWITMIDSSKNTLNVNDINTLYSLQLATYVKNTFQNLQIRFKSNWRSLKFKVWKWKFNAPTIHTQPVHNVLRTSPYGPILVETSRTMIGPK